MSYFDNFKIKVESPGIPDFAMNRPINARKVKGDLGLELELEASNSLPWDSGHINSGVPPCPVTGGYWVAKEDGSLRGGVEYVTSTAVEVSSVEELVHGLYKNIEGYKTKLTLSNRCSTHIHLNATGWRINEITSFMLLWSLFEPVLIDWCGPRRKVNHFCLSLEDAPTTYDAFSDFFKQGYFDFPEGAKYCALNLRRLGDLGTIEIRCGDASERPERVVTWAKFLNQLRVFAKSQENPAAVPAMISGETPRGLFAQLCDDAGLVNFFQEVVSLQDNFDRRCYTSFREAIHLAYHPWDDWLPEIRKDYVINPFSDGAAKKPRAVRGARELPPEPPREQANFNVERLLRQVEERERDFRGIQQLRAAGQRARPLN